VRVLMVSLKYRLAVTVLEVVTCLHIIANVWLHLPPNPLI